jgi:hypothetical protein
MGGEGDAMMRVVCCLSRKINPNQQPRWLCYVDFALLLIRTHVKSHRTRTSPDSTPIQPRFNPEQADRRAKHPLSQGKRILKMFLLKVGKSKAERSRSLGFSRKVAALRLRSVLELPLLGH